MTELGRTLNGVIITASVRSPRDPRPCRNPPGTAELPVIQRVRFAVCAQLACSDGAGGHIRLQVSCSNCPCDRGDAVRHAQCSSCARGYCCSKRSPLGGVACCIQQYLCRALDTRRCLSTCCSASAAAPVNRLCLRAGAQPQPLRSYDTQPYRVGRHQHACPHQPDCLALHAEG